MHPLFPKASALTKTIRFCLSTRRNLSYMKLLNVPIGLLINFHEMKVTEGVSRLILPGANLK